VGCGDFLCFGNLLLLFLLGIAERGWKVGSLEDREYMNTRSKFR